MKPAALRIFSLLVLLALLGWLVVDRMSPREESPGTGASDRAERSSHRDGPMNAGGVVGEPDENTKLDEVATFLAMAKDATVDADERERRIMELGRAGDSTAARALMALGDEDTYLNFAAINALASIKNPEVDAYLVKKLQHGDPRMIAAAASSLAAIAGKTAVPSIAATLKDNRLRADGQQDVVCAACVEAFKRIGDASALPALAEELEKTVGVSLSYDYGSRIVSVIREIGDPAGIPILQSYATRLGELESGSADNPKAEHFFQSEIQKATEAMDYLGQGRE